MALVDDSETCERVEKKGYERFLRKRGFMTRKVLLPAGLSLATMLLAGFFTAGGSMAQTPSPTAGTPTATPTATRPAGTGTPAATATAAAPAATATPRPATSITVPTNVCSQPLPQASGGQTISLGNVTTTLPSSGGTFVWGEADAGGNLLLVVCNTATNATVMINTTTGQEVGRLAATPEGNAVLNQVVAGSRASGTSVGGTAITPPSTGSAGLRSTDESSP
jgi:hypothetical protein